MKKRSHEGSGTEDVASMADCLADLALSRWELWHDSSDTAFASIGRRSFRVRSKEAKHWLTGNFHRQFDKVPATEALNNALSAVEAAAIYDGPQNEAYVRVAHMKDRIYIHLADQDDTVLSVSARGWGQCEHPPVRFVRSQGAQPLPQPERGGSLDELRTVLNMPDDDMWCLAKAWMTAAIGGSGPFPLLVLTGEQGSAKSTTARMIKMLVDPSAAPIRSEPKEGRDLMITARSTRVLAFDNLSRIQPWLSDALCRLATGGGFSTRQLYSDADEIIFDAMRPVILNGISDFVSRPDLLERAIILRHPTIPEARRRTEQELVASFERMRPRLLGALLDRLAGVLREQANVRIAKLPRMADFAVQSVAAERGVGEPERFLQTFQRTQTEAEAVALEGEPLASTLLRWLPSVGEWEGSASELMGVLSMSSNEHERRSRDWPSGPRELVERLIRLAPGLRRLGVEYRRDGNVGRGDQKRTRQCLVWLPSRESQTAPVQGEREPSGTPRNDQPGVGGADGAGLAPTLKGKDAPAGGDSLFEKRNTNRSVGPYADGF